jgi:hypothetical protein
VARKFLDWAKSKGTKIWWGEGKIDGSLIPTLKTKSEEYYPIVVSTNGSLGFQFWVLKKRKAFKDEEKRLEILERLNTIEGISLPQSSIEGIPCIKMDSLKKEKNLEEFISILNWMEKEGNRQLEN